MNPKFLFILMCYNNESEIVTFVRQELAAQTLQDFRCVVVNNASEHPEALSQLTKDPAVMLVNPGKNEGYLGGAAVGLKAYLETAGGLPADFVIVCNTDVQFTGNDFLERLYDQYEDDAFDVFGPDIVSSLTGKHQNPYLERRISKRKLQFFINITQNSVLYNAFLLLYYPFKRHIKRSVREKGSPYSLHGSFLVFSGNFFEKGGHLSYGSFLFGEEIFIGELAGDLKLNVLYDPDYKIVHHEHATTGIYKSAIHVRYLHDSYKYIMTTYYS
ncbi:MAG: glycosyltransferase family 2 protein [Bacteroidales bacterium]